MKLWEFLKEHMLSNPEQEICENDAFMTFEEMVIWSEIFAENLKGRKCCAILCSSEMATAMSLLACFAAGVTAVPISMRYGQLHCKKILAAISPDTVISDSGGGLKVHHVTDPQYQLPLKHPALIMCTSGTTGTPKGAMLSENNLIANVTDIAEYFAINEKDTILIVRPLYHCAVLTGEFLTALVKGCKIRFYSEVFHPGRMLELIKKHEITAFCGTPTLLSMMARLQRGNSVNSLTLKHICISGECMGKETGIRIADAFPRADIYSMYGLTEACPRVSYLPPEWFRDYGDCVGVPLPSVSLKILRDDGTLAAREEIGTLFVKGDNVMLGYYNDPEKTAEVLKDGWLCTGDLALINEAGLLQIKGRNDDLIIKVGMNIYPAEIEGALKTDPRVKEVLVFAEQDDKLGTQIILHMVGDFTEEGAVREMCKKYLPLYQMPNKIKLLSELPKNGSGKIVRRRNYA